MYMCDSSSVDSVQFSYIENELGNCTGLWVFWRRPLLLLLSLVVGDLSVGSSDYLNRCVCAGTVLVLCLVSES